ncbi:type II toxin-antitoxin system VapC family toxin [Streptomyces sp. BPTC-684]|uniref:type II toxin-antitoxin system VapC family toxin n=1 Tax=Streptomyces sp. BPTC-684 TaxID=3043734 RepID=UPI0024B0C2DF|nr:type II toxin-antitoxin system VapC family toxin [Streptomyces sp. BPTC-684]WHM38507.1 type II toxin-antitoxin system VapC family toxin [Streptomyces sp. BPTC-684]
MIVVDASVLTEALTGDGTAGKAARARLMRDTHWAAPEHLAVETFHAVRGRLLGQKITPERADAAVAALARVALETVAVQPLVRRMWELRQNVSGYDAAYIAAAEAFGCPLITGDARLGRCGAARCQIEVIG